MSHDPSRFASDAAIRALVEGFEAATLAPDEWDHAAHLAVGTWYVTSLGHEGAVAAMRAGIQKLNRAHAIPDAPGRGYHETITLLFLRLIACVVARSPGRSLPAHVAAAIRELPARVVREHYSTERLSSTEARHAWVEPDLRPLPPLTPGDALSHPTHQSECP